MDLTRLEALIDKYEHDEGAVIALLQDVQAEENYLPREALEHIAERLQVPLIQLYGLATFYKAFTLKPKGKHQVVCCMGTACHVRGGQRVVEAFERELGIRAGDTTEDLEFSLETVNCVGACAVSPIAIVDGHYYGHMSPSKIKRLLQQHRSDKGAPTNGKP